MNNFNTAGQEILTGDVINTPIGSNFGIMSLSTNRQSRALINHARLEATEVCCRSAVAKTALDCTAALSVLEGEIVSQAPWAAGRCKAIVDAYTMRTLQQIGQQ